MKVYIEEELRLHEILTSTPDDSGLLLSISAAASQRETIL
jgi:hypothetical protein